MTATLGILLAGGRGERLGAGVPKALAVLASVSLLERAIGTLRAACDRVVVAAPAALALPLPPGVAATHDPGEGPLVALALALSQGDFERACVLGVDYPLVPPELLTGLQRLLEPPVLAVMPRIGGVLQPLVAAYAPASLPALSAAAASGERSLVRALSRLEPRAIEGEALEALAGGEERLLNVNGPGDLERAARALAAGAGR